MPQGPSCPMPAPLAPTHPRKGLPGVEVGLAPRLWGLLQLLPPPPPPSRRRTLSPSRCSAGSHRRAKPGRRRAVPGLGVCYPAAQGPPPPPRAPLQHRGQRPARALRAQPSQEVPCARLRTPASQPERGRGAARRAVIPPASSSPA